MTEMTLAQAVGKLATATHEWSDEELERPWAWQAYDDGVRHAFFRTYEELCELAATTGANRAAEGRGMTTAQQALAQHHRAYRHFQGTLIGVDDLLDLPPAEGEWPLRDIIGHIMGAEAGFFAVIWHALERGRRGDPPVEITPEEKEALVGTFDDLKQMVASSSLAGILEEYDALHRRVLHELADIREDELDIPSLWWEGEPMSIQFRLHRFNSHLRQHAIQAEKTLAALNYRPSETRRLLRMIYKSLGDAEGAVLGAGDLGAEQARALAAGITARVDEIAEGQD